jgi:hypothetical protein
MSLKHIDMEGALRRLAERRIEDAMKEGKFDNLPGRGAPLELEPMPLEENARMTWWAIRILRRNDITPHEVQWRKALDHLRRRLSEATEARQVVELVEQFNQLVHRINTLGTNALKSGVAPLCAQTEVQRMRERVGEVE